MSTIRNSTLAAALLALIWIGPAGCPPNGGQLGGAATSGLIVQFGQGGSSQTIATVIDTLGSLSATIAGNQSSDSYGMTDVYGTTASGVSFAVTYSDGDPTALETPNLSLQLTKLDDSTYDISVPTAESSKPVAWSRDFTLSPGLYNSYAILYLEAVRCQNATDCPSERASRLGMLSELAYSQMLFDGAFNDGCLDSQSFSEAGCMDLLAVIDTLGRIIEGVIANDSTMPASVRNLCFTVDPACDALVYTPTSSLNDTGTGGSSSDGSTSGDDPTGTGTDTDGTDDSEPPDVSVSISGPDEIQVGNSGTFTASASGTTGASFTWDLLGSAATLNGTSGYSTSVSGASVGTVTLVVEARAPGYENVLATSTHAISVAPGTEYVVWYDTGNNCWDAPQLKVSSRSSFDSATVEGEKVEMQGGFATTEAAWSWLCSAVDSKKPHAWCGIHYNIGGSYYMIATGICDLSSIPNED